MSPLTILAVDAEPNILEVIRFAFEREGCTVRIANTAAAALVDVSMVVPDAVIIGDVFPMPASSLNLITDLRTATVGLNLPIVVVTTQARPANLSQCLKLGANLAVPKPFNVKSLTLSVLALIAGYPVNA